MTFDKHAWLEVLNWAETANAIVVVDEAYIDLCYRHDACSVLTVPGWERRCIVLQSVSKGFDATCLCHPVWTNMAKKRYDQLHRRLNNGLRQAGFDAPMPEAGLCQFTPAPRRVNDYEFSSIVDCVQWFREKLRISLMHYVLPNDAWWLRWAVTIKPVPECGLSSEDAVIEEACRRLTQKTITFNFSG